MIKKAYIVVFVILTFGVIWWNYDAIASLLHSGFNQNGKVGKVTEEKKDGKSNGQEKEEHEKEVRKEKPKAERKIINDTDYSQYSNIPYAWWFKRNDVHEKSGCQEDFDIGQYDAFYIVPTTEKVMYVTFDCGYENGFTPGILDVLKETDVQAAFFVTQTFIRDNVELVKRMKEEGHLVCNHTVTHPSMPTKTVGEQQQELMTCEEYMKEATGCEMDLFYRPPKGEYSEQSLQVAKDLGYTTVFWSMAYLDYDVNNQPSTGHVIEHFEKYYHPGAIPLLHNVSKANHDALKQVICNLKAEGYTFGSLYDLKNQD